MIFGALFGSVFVQTGVVQSQVHKDQLQDRIEEQRELQARLSLEVARLESPDRILNQAQVRLGMVSPDDRPYLAPVVPDDPSTPLAPPGADPFGVNS
jgi:cell division protein FtsL